MTYPFPAEQRAQFTPEQREQIDSFLRERADRVNFPRTYLFQEAIRALLAAHDALAAVSSRHEIIADIIAALDKEGRASAKAGWDHHDHKTIRAWLLEYDAAKLAQDQSAGGENAEAGRTSPIVSPDPQASRTGKPDTVDAGVTGVTAGRDPQSTAALAEGEYQSTPNPPAAWDLAHPDKSGSGNASPAADPTPALVAELDTLIAAMPERLREQQWSWVNAAWHSLQRARDEIVRLETEAAEGWRKAEANGLEAADLERDLATARASAGASARDAMCWGELTKGLWSQDVRRAIAQVGQSVDAALVRGERQDG